MNAGDVESKKRKSKPERKGRNLKKAHQGSIASCNRVGKFQILAEGQKRVPFKEEEPSIQDLSVPHEPLILRGRSTASRQRKRLAEKRSPA